MKMVPVPDRCECGFKVGKIAEGTTVVKCLDCHQPIPIKPKDKA